MARTFVGLSTVDADTLPVSCGGCMFWQSPQALPHECCVADDAEAAREWERSVLAEWGECGRAAVADGRVLGFVRYAPPRFFPQTRHMPAGLPDADACMIACLHIAPEARRRGLGGLLLHEAMRDMASRGERAVQAYGTTKLGDPARSPLVGVEFLLRNGFVISRAHPSTPLLRADLKALSSWSENLEALLEALRIPLAAPRRAPATYVTPGGEA